MIFGGTKSKTDITKAIVADLKLPIKADGMKEIN